MEPARLSRTEYLLFVVSDPESKLSNRFGSVWHYCMERLKMPLLRKFNYGYRAANAIKKVGE
jgi:hypothetical protein